MGDEVLRRYATRLETEGPAAVLEPDAIDDLGCFGWLRGARERALFLELRKASGDSLAIACGLIETVAFDPSEGITITAGVTVARICGRNLAVELRPGIQLHQGLLRQRISWVQEAGESAATLAPEGECVVEQVAW
ncbi:MAG: hypothetical protein AAF628_34085 [Planctomycetota bacterium]